MLPSQIASMQQCSTSTSLLRSSRCSSVPLLRSTVSLPRRPRSQHQIRTIRIGLWSSYLEPSYQKEWKRRHRAMRYKYIDALNRKLSWEHPDPAFAKQVGFKGFMCSAWRGHDARPGGRWVDMSEVEKLQFHGDSKTATGVQDTAQTAFDKLWESKNGIYDILKIRRRKFKSLLQSLQNTSPYDESISRLSSEMDKLRRRLQRNEPPSEEDYIIDPITNRKVYAVDQEEGNRKPIDVPVKTFKGYRAKFQDFKSFKDSTTSAIAQQTKPIIPTSSGSPVESDRAYLQDFEIRNSYKPFLAYEPDGQKSDVDQTLHNDSQASSCLGKGSQSASEDLDSTRQSLRDFDSRTSYGSYRWNEPDGKVIENSDGTEQGLKDYDAIFSRGLPESDRDVVESRDYLKDYDAKTTYKAVLDEEPFKRSADPVQEGLQDYDRVTSYESTHFNDPTEQASRRSKKTSLNSNDRLDVSNRYNRASDEVKLMKRKELERDFQSSEVPGLSTTEEILAAKKINLASTTAAASQSMTGSFVRDFPEEFETRWTMGAPNSGNHIQRSETDAWGYDKRPKGLELSYDQEVESNVQNAEKEYIDGLAGPRTFSRNPHTPRIQTSLDRSNSTQPETFKNELATTEFATDLYSYKPQGLETSYREEVKLQHEADPYARAPQGLETSFSQDLQRQNDIDPYSKTPQGLETNYTEEIAAEGGRSSFVSTYSSLKSEPSNEAISKVPEPQDYHTVLKKEGQDLVREIRKIYEERYGIIDIKHRQVPESLKQEIPVPEKILEEVKAHEVHEPTIYKILAYDPTMQSISIATTTSIVPDSAATLTPAEVLVRLSSPSKFFSHFETLQAQGYEIVSGSGDVLVFRKVHAEGQSGMKMEENSDIESRTRKNTNPIDGMQPIATTGNFASPTGFVNHDLPTSKPAFKSNIDVRREEPVFSGKTSWSEASGNSPRRKIGIGRRIIYGGLMAGGCSYAIGVMAEYFKTGGIDGLGPQGF